MVRWEELSMPEKAEMMKVAIRNGITTLPEIKQAYREFAEGGDISTNETDTYNVEGNLFKKGGSKKKSTVNPAAQRAMRYFMDKGLTDYQAAGLVGNLMRESGMNPNAVNGGSQAYGLAQWLGSRKKALFAKYGNNPTFENQLDFIWSELNSTHRNGLKHIKASKNAEEAARNAMGYYEFSVGPAGAIANMKKYGQDGEGSMMKGIGFASSLMGQPVPTSTAYSDSPQLPITETIPQEDFSFTPMNPQVFGMQMPAYQTPVIVPEQPLVAMAEQTTPIPEQIERQRIIQEKAEQRDALNRFGLLMSMSNPQQDNNMMGVVGMLAGNTFAKGGGIHIKPSHRGRFTRLKERTGHSASWFKEHGTPAQKKMATFALNAAKWKHGYGGNLFEDGGDLEERPPIVPFTQKEEVIITPDSEYNKYLNTLPDNQRFTSNDKYDSYLYWKLNGKPKNFKEAYNKGMFNYDHSDNGYHANSIAWGEDGIGYFMKPKTHDTVHMETDWFNKGLVTEEGGWQRPETFLEWKESRDFRDNYDLVDDPNRPNFYKYQPKKRALGGNLYDGILQSSQYMDIQPNIFELYRKQE